MICGCIGLGRTKCTATSAPRIGARLEVGKESYADYFPTSHINITVMFSVRE